MAASTITNFWYPSSCWGQELVVAVKAAMLVTTQIMVLNGLFVLAKLHRICLQTQHKLAMGMLVLGQVHGVQALPVPSGGSSTDIAVKSYNLNRTSFIVMAAMSAIMTAVSLINGFIAIAKLCSRRRDHNSIPRHPANCEDGAAAHEALGQPVIGSIPAVNSEEELSSSTSDAITSAGAGGTDPMAAKHPRPPQQTAPMPLERLCRNPGSIH
ncbi:hypothetical protein ANO14919_041110 [Xylariales sp. No.14919]|nr:hypothetical protein F5X98DRAFT_372371 [Xylaria grammica]GAW14708.1 hypothetical protein ANO14919_041110 [Xylariales sp. No.14919]